MSPRSFHHTLLNWLLPVLVFAAGSTLYFFDLRHFIPTTQRKNDLVFAADTRDTVRALREPTYEGDMQKHLLFSFTLAPLVDLVQLAPAMNESRAIRAVLALVAGLNITLMYLWILGLLKSIYKALLFTGFYMISFGVLVVYSIPETYALSNLIAIVYLLATSRLQDAPSWKNHLMLTGLAGLASLYNPPLLSLMTVHLVASLESLPLRQWLVRAMTGVWAGAGIFFAGNLSVYYASGFLSFMQAYSSKWGSASNYLQPEKVLNVLAVFYFFDFVSPVTYTPSILGLEDFKAYFSSLDRLAMMLAISAGLAYSLWMTLRHFTPRKSLLLGLTAWALVITLFYIYFNPLEAVLYASQITAPLVYILASGMEQLQMKDAVKYLLFGLVICFMAWHNLAALLSGFTP